MIFVLNSAGVRVFFAHFFEEKFCDGRGRGCHSLCGGAVHWLGVPRASGPPISEANMLRKRKRSLIGYHISP